MSDVSTLQGIAAAGGVLAAMFAIFVAGQGVGQGVT